MYNVCIHVLSHHIIVYIYIYIYIYIIEEESNHPLINYYNFKYINNQNGLINFQTP